MKDTIKLKCVDGPLKGKKLKILRGAYAIIVPSIVGHEIQMHRYELRFNKNLRPKLYHNNSQAIA
jgi:hypothetical protein